ncbi:MAG: BamA/TamA family outer membrane protein [bacterium]|nr:MAG: BamA/TamA family outer membrane protein [bacterium]
MPRKSNFIICMGVILLLPSLAFHLCAQSDYEGKIIKEIRFEGLKRTKEYIVTRELISRVGEPCLKENLDQEYQRIELLDVFSKIDINTQLDQDSVIVIYRFVETFPILPSISFKISDENGISAGGGLKSPNLLGKDIFFAGRVVAGGETEVEVWLENPWITGNHLGYKLEYYHRERDNLIGDFNESADEFYLRIGSYLGRKGRIGGSLEFLRVRSDRDSVTLSPDNSDKVSRVGVYLGFDSRDSFSDTQRGWWNEIAYTREIRFFENSSDFNQLDIDIRRYQPIPFWNRHTLALFSLLTLRTGEIGKEIAPWQQFGLGGTNTIRGWEFASRKGINQFINTAEYRVTVVRPSLLQLPFGIDYRGGLQLAVFGDAGIVWSDAAEFKDQNFIAGGGFGIRFLLPIFGMARVDFGWGQGGKGVFLHLGAFEKPLIARRRVR